MSDQLNLGGKIVLVTGGTMGAGKGITERFLEMGSEVIICARHAPPAPIEAGGKQAVFLECNVRSLEEVDRLLAQVVERYGRLDVLVNNAGGSPPAPAAAASPRFSSAIIDLNLVAPLNLCQKANAIMQAQPEGGCIINIGSVSALRPSPDTSAYGAAKAGLMNLTTTLAVEWAPKVRVNSVACGMILTEKSHLHFGGDEKGLAACAATVPMGRLALPRDVGDVCLFLASSLAGYVTGSSVLLHGGGERPAFLGAVEQSKQA